MWDRKSQIHLSSIMTSFIISFYDEFCYDICETFYSNWVVESLSEKYRSPKNAKTSHFVGRQKKPMIYIEKSLISIGPGLVMSIFIDGYFE